MSDEAQNPSGAGEAPRSESVDRRTRLDRREGERRKGKASVSDERRSGGERRKGSRRAARSINQYDMEPEVLEFIQAINAFKERTGRAFPSWSDVLSILKSLGYEKHS